jgi:hypothetical protein
MKYCSSLSLSATNHSVLTPQPDSHLDWHCWVHKKIQSPRQSNVLFHWADNFKLLLKVRTILHQLNLMIIRRFLRNICLLIASASRILMPLRQNTSKINFSYPHNTPLGHQSKLTTCRCQLIICLKFKWPVAPSTIKPWSFQQCHDTHNVLREQYFTFWLSFCKLYTWLFTQRKPKINCYKSHNNSATKSKCSQYILRSMWR